MAAHRPVKSGDMKSVRLNGARKGEIRAGLDRTLAAARDAGQVKDSQAVVVATAERLATMADAAWRADNANMFIQATTKLNALLSKLGLDGSGGVERDGEGTAGNESVAPADVIERELASILGAGPAIRNKPHA